MNSCLNEAKGADILSISWVIVLVFGVESNGLMFLLRVLLGLVRFLRFCTDFIYK